MANTLGQAACREEECYQSPRLEQFDGRLDQRADSPQESMNPTESMNPKEDAVSDEISIPGIKRKSTLVSSILTHFTPSPQPPNSHTSWKSLFKRAREMSFAGGMT